LPTACRRNQCVKPDTKPIFALFTAQFDSTTTLMGDKVALNMKNE
jgi:hypothetical protein